MSLSSIKKVIIMSFQQTFDLSLKEKRELADRDSSLWAICQSCKKKKYGWEELRHGKYVMNLKTGESTFTCKECIKKWKKKKHS